MRYHAQRAMLTCSFALCVSALVAAGCGSSSNEATTAANAGSADGKKDVKVTFIMPTLANEAFKQNVDFAKKAAAADGHVDLKIVAGTKGDAAEQIDNLNTAVASKPDAILIGAADTNALQKPLIRAQKTSKIVSLAQDIPGMHLDGLVLFPDLEGGKTAGRYIAQHVPRGSKIAIISCFPGQYKTIDDRVDGAKSAWAGMEYKIVATLDGKCDDATGRAVTNDLITAHPDVDAIFSVSDSQTIGAIGALERAKKDPFFVSYDAQPTVLKALQEGRLDGDVDTNIPKGSEAALELTAAVARGESSGKVIRVSPTLVDKSNVDQVLAGSQ